MSVFTWPVRVYWEDTDASGVVYHANYLRWFERSRTEWLRAKGFDQESMRTQLGIAFTIASLEIRYIRPARLDDELRAEVVTVEAGRASLHFCQRLVRAGNSEIMAETKVRAGCVDASTFRPRALPVGGSTVDWSA
ncbi:MAG: tol-pal system-associated acyl-CoA thioesterase [Panacagrimonas sp.]